MNNERSLVVKKENNLMTQFSERANEREFCGKIRYIFIRNFRTASELGRSYNFIREKNFFFFAAIKKKTNECSDA